MAQTEQRSSTGLRSAQVHAILACSDVTRSRDFFVDTLGLKQRKFNEGTDAELEAGDGSVLYLYQRPGTRPSEATVCGFNVEDLEKTVNDLRTRGVTFEQYDMPGLKTQDGIAESDGWRAAWFKDPDGNIIAVGER